MFFSVLCLLCFCARLFICALWSPTGNGLLLSHWYPGSGVILDCTASWSLHPYLLQSADKMMATIFLG